MHLYHHLTEMEAEAPTKWFALGRLAKPMAEMDSGLFQPQICLLLLNTIIPLLLQLLMEINNTLTAYSLREQHGKAEL